MGLVACNTTQPGAGATPTHPPPATQVQPNFTPEEKAWLEEHPVIRMGVETNFPPYEFVDDKGLFTGISADYREIIQRKLGVDLQVQQFPDFATIRDKIKNKELDVVLLLTPTADRRNYILFTQPFFNYQLVIVTRDDHPVVFGLDEFKGKRVAVVEGYASAEYISKNYPQLDVVSYPTIEEGLMAVSTGKADAFVNEVFATVYHIRNKSISNLKIAASLNTGLPGYAIGIRNDWTELVPILEKVLATITPEERLQISDKWLSVKYERGFDYSLFWKVLLGGLLVLGVIFYWNRRLTREVILRKQSEAALRASEDELINYQHHLEELVKERTADIEAKNITLADEIAERKRAQEDLEESEANFRAMAENASDAILISSGEAGYFVFANCQAEELTGYSAAELRKIRIPDLVQKPEQGKILEYYRKRLRGDSVPSQYETIYIRKGGMEIPVEITAAQIRWQGEPASMAIIRDISERKKREAEMIQQNYELEVLAELSLAIRKIEKPSELAEFILAKSMELLQMEGGVVMILEGSQLVSIVEKYLPSGHNPLPKPFNEELLHILSSNQAVVFSQNAENFGFQTQGLPQKLASWAAVPLKSLDSPVGLMLLTSSESRAFAPQENRLASSIAELAGNALERLRTMATLEERVADRTRDLSTLYQVMTVANQTIQLDQILEQALNLALQAVNCSQGCIVLLDMDSSSLQSAYKIRTTPADMDGFWDSLVHSTLAEEIITQNKPRLISGLKEKSRISDHRGQWLSGEPDREPNGELIGVPLYAGGTVRGILWGYSDQTGHLTLEDVALLVSIGERVGTTIENFKLRERTQQVAILEERQRLARDLHDSVTQQIYSLLLLSGGAKKSLNSQDREKASQLIQRIEEIGRQAIKELRLLIFELRPLDLQQVGLVEALRQRINSVEQRGGIDARLLAFMEARIPVEIEEELYRIAIEALNNSLKYAAASCVWVRVQSEAGKIELEISDNGRGFDMEETKSGGSGLQNMRERAQRMGAALKITSTPGSGTTITATVEA
jgi:PAS domain S-box-containing protein